MNISITPELEKFVDDEVKTSLYQSASEVIRAGLRRLKEDKERKPGFMVSPMADLEDKLLVGIGQLDREEGIPGDQVIAELKAHNLHSWRSELGPGLADSIQRNSPSGVRRNIQVFSLINRRRNAFKSSPIGRR